MGKRARHDDDVERPMPHRLIGDIDVAAVRVAGLGHTQISHGLVPNLSPYYPDDRHGTIMQLASSTRHKVRSGSSTDLCVACELAPFLPQQRTCGDCGGMSVWCQKLPF